MPRRFLIAALLGPLFWSHLLGQVQRQVILRSPPVYQTTWGSDHPLHQTAATVQPLHLTESSMLQLTLRPAHRISSRVVLRAFVIRDGQDIPWPLQFEQSASGVFHLRAPVRDLPSLHSGQGALYFRLKTMPAPSIFDSFLECLALLGFPFPEQVLSCPFEVSEPVSPSALVDVAPR